MLQSLHIENFAIIDRLEVEFGEGLNVITGETGAGKTIIAQALNLILGDRASTDLVRSGEERARVTATFSVKEAAAGVRRKLDELGIDVAEGLIIHRLVNADGKSKATINGTPATQQTLKEIAEHLVDISSQHEHQLLLDPATHVHIVDQFGNLQGLAEKYAETHKEYITLHEQLEKMRQKEQETKERLDFMKYQLSELKNAQLVAGEDERLETERSRIKHAVQLESRMREAERLLYESSGSAVEVVGQVCESLASCAQIDSTVVPWRDTAARISSEMADMAREIKLYTDKLDSDPARLEQIDDRIHLLKGLKKKHGGTIESCIEKLSSLEREIGEVENWDEVVAEKEELLAKAKEQRAAAAEILSKKREKTARELEKEVGQEAAGLGFKRLKFTVSMMELPQEQWGAEGKEKIEFLIAPNLGEKPRPLAKIVSGGELSRIMLAVKRVLSDRAGLVLTSIFDEVDAGIGGATAEIVGRKLKEVAKNRQVICITHLPQIASFGEYHFVVAKKVVKERTVATMESLSGESRVGELARMLGGVKISDATRTHAVEMLKNAK